jgi:glycosyltransferase involved in cell wall biosynthesis
MDNTLLFLTKSFPYGTDEAFIENEMPYIYKTFSKVVIIACDVPPMSKEVRPVSNKCKVFRIDSKPKKIHKLQDIVSGIRCLFCPSEILKQEYKLCPNLLAKIFLTYFEGKSKRILSEILTNGYLNSVQDGPVVLYSYWMFTTAKIGADILALKAINCIYSFTRAHRYDLYEDKNPVGYLPYRTLFFNRYNHIFPCSNNGTFYLQQRYPAWKDKIKTAFLGSLDHGLNPAGCGDVFRIVSCSRIHPIKRVEKIIEAISLLDKPNTSLEWIHIGGKGKSLKRLEEFAKKKLRHVKYILHGALTNLEVLDYYTNTPVDIFVNVSFSEGLPVSIMEAMSFGIPVLATDVGGTSEIVLDKENGYLIPKDFKVWQMSDIISLFCIDKNSDTVQKMRKKARNHWENCFQADLNYGEFYKTLQDITLKENR